MDENWKELKYEIVKNCEPHMYTPLWETISIIEKLYPSLNEYDKIETGEKVIIDLVHKGFIELYFGSAFITNEYTLIPKNEIKNILDLKAYWFSDLAPQEKYVEIYLTLTGVDLAIEKTSLDNAKL